MVSSIKTRLGPGELTPEGLRDRFADTRLPEDPLDVVMPPGSDRWPEPMRRQLENGLRPAGVLVPLMQRPGGLTLLLTQRAADLTHHGGQISFPGGRIEEHDASVQETALRETHEEVGIAPHHVDVIGYLRAMPVITGFAVTPVVGLVADAAEIRVDQTEVDFAFEVPLDFLFDLRNDRPVERELYGSRFRMTEFHYEDKRIWGATAYMILSLRKYVLNK